MTFKILNALWKNLAFMVRNGASISLLKGAWVSAREQAFVEAAGIDAKREYLKAASDVSFTTDWFSNNIPFWLAAFERATTDPDEVLRVLEIGSFEGRSTVFVLRHFPKAQVDCVDTWLGSDEHAGEEFLNDLHGRFLVNIKPFSERVTCHKMTSAQFFRESSNDEYDIVYIDGSHRATDVLLDLVNSWDRLRSGGLLLIDDYLWKHYKTAGDNPCSAVNAFVSIYKKQVRFLRVGYQVYIQKTSF
jgi:predicted O-methyltransferase YrrM